MNNLITLDGNNIRLTLPDISAWGFHEWAFFVLAVSAIYGLVTHLTSLPAIHRYKKLAEINKITSGRVGNNITTSWLLVLLFWRMTLQLWFRIIALIIGVIGIPVLSLATGRICLWNECLSEAFTWFLRPKELSERLVDD